jgi:uncharacterized protein YecE (DUF72 family)
LKTSPAIRVGTCAWSFDDWRGVFYPEHLPSARRLEIYAHFFPLVEADSTFYHAPSPEVARHWAEMTPEDFRFTCKLPREISHERKLRDVGGELKAFLEAIEPLRPKLECVLLQLPPWFVIERDEHALRDFLALLPAGLRVAVEFRHEGWLLPRVMRLLEKHRVCWVWSDVSPIEDQLRGPFELFPQTADFLYIRLLGDLDTKYRGHGERIHRYTGLMWPRAAALDAWADRIQQHLPGLSRVYVLVNNHFEGFSPATCRRLAERLGVELPAPAPAPAPSAQMELL